MPWVPQHDDDFPTLGWDAIDWISAMLSTPDKGEYVPFVLYPEQEDFLLRFYELDPATGKRKITRGVISRPRGWGKSPFVGAIMCLEAMGPVLFDGWNAEGQPVGKPWSAIRTPLIHIAATSEDQTANTWSAVLEMLDGPVIDEYPGLEPMASFVNLPVGKMMPISASGRSVKGARTVFGAMDQTETWTRGNGGHLLAQNMRSNAAKIGGTTIETPNAFTPGDESVAEESAKTWQMMLQGQTQMDDSLLYDHREAPGSTELSDKESLIHGLRVAYGDSSGDPRGCLLHDPACPPGHADLERLVVEIWDPGKDVQVSRSDFLNQVTHAADAWISRPELMACLDVDKVLVPGDTIVLGFDGSKGRARGKADATALMGVRVADGYCFEVKVWEQPDGPAGTNWTPPVLDVDAMVRRMFEDYNVIGFYADPSGWTTQVAAWEAAFHRKLKIKATRDAPITVWPRGKGSAVAEHVQRLHDAITNREMTHSGTPYLVSHLLNARQRPTSSGYLLYKAFPESRDKIDAAYALTMAWKAYLEAKAKGYGGPRRSRSRITVLT